MGKKKKKNVVANETNKKKENIINKMAMWITKTKKRKIGTVIIALVGLVSFIANIGTIAQWIGSFGGNKPVEVKIVNDPIVPGNADAKVTITAEKMTNSYGDTKVPYHKTSYDVNIHNYADYDLIAEYITVKFVSIEPYSIPITEGDFFEKDGIVYYKIWNLSDIDAINMEYVINTYSCDDMCMRVNNETWGHSYVADELKNVHPNFIDHGVTGIPAGKQTLIPILELNQPPMVYVEDNTVMAWVFEDANFYPTDHYFIKAWCLGWGVELSNNDYFDFGWLGMCGAEDDYYAVVVDLPTNSNSFEKRLSYQEEISSKGVTKFFLDVVPEHTTSYSIIIEVQFSDGTIATSNIIESSYVVVPYYTYDYYEGTFGKYDYLDYVKELLETYKLRKTFGEEYDY